MEQKTALLSFPVCLLFSSKFISRPNKNLVLFKNKQANKPETRHFLGFLISIVSRWLEMKRSVPSHGREKSQRFAGRSKIWIKQLQAAFPRAAASP